MRIDGPTSVDAVLWAARRTIEMHQVDKTATRLTGRCAECPDNPDHCKLLHEATLTVQTAELPHPQT